MFFVFLGRLCHCISTVGSITICITREVQSDSLQWSEGSSPVIDVTSPRSDCRISYRHAGMHRDKPRPVASGIKAREINKL
ncbi:hypothetical protein RRG08_021781 [Elysia crispata]|uniref:Secreted protein n=1 Tax=Elysia crispata TaxID=231223 RepID=A0AAE0ZY89_9GAST|nr:hypothetical protein RRG08_021781 [Elysia crispata]